MADVRLLHINRLGVVGLVLVACLFAGCETSKTKGNDPGGQTSAASDSNFVFYPPSPDKPRLQFLVSFTTSGDLGDGANKKASGFERLSLRRTTWSTTTTSCSKTTCGRTTNHRLA